MKPGDVSPVLRSAAGFHIVKLLERRSRNEPTVVDQTHARHILIRVNEVTSEADAKAKIERLKDRLESGAKFEELAKLNSEDPSAAKGGDLGWLSPGDTVPAFERSDEQARAQPGIGAGALAVRLASDRGPRAAQAGRDRGPRAHAGAARDPSAQVRRRLPGLGSADARSTRTSKCGSMRSRRSAIAGMDLASVFAEPLVDLGAETPAFAGIYTPESFHGATKVGVTVAVPGERRAVSQELLRHRLLEFPAGKRAAAAGGPRCAARESSTSDRARATR